MASHVSDQAAVFEDFQHDAGDRQRDERLRAGMITDGEFGAAELNRKPVTFADPTRIALPRESVRY